MFILMPVIFVLGILAIALEDKIKICLLYTSDPADE